MVLSPRKACGCDDSSISTVAPSWPPTSLVGRPVRSDKIEARFKERCEKLRKCFNLGSPSCASHSPSGPGERVEIK